ncbi:MAG: hypothetical protein Q9182_001370 [Xanthomendoza sp. 2 TL-2023]
MPEPKACTAEMGTCYCEGCSPGRTKRAQQYRDLLQTPIFRLPHEMLHNILERIDLVNFPPFLIACYHLLRMRGFGRSYPSSMLHVLLLRLQQSENQPSCLQNLPQELLLAVGHTLDVNEKISMVLAAYRMRIEDIELITHLR